MLIYLAFHNNIHIFNSLIIQINGEMNKTRSIQKKIIIYIELKRKNMDCINIFWEITKKKFIISNRVFSKSSKLQLRLS